MGWDNKVVWTEGMFLRAQHFQQFDRYVERLVRGRVDGLRPHAWGVAEIAINRELLSIGKFALVTCGGILDDGTPFRIPDDVDHPPPLDIPDNTRNCIVYLCLPVRQPGAVEVSLREGDASAARYEAGEHQAADVVAGSGAEAPVQIGRLRLRYLLEMGDRAGYVCLGLARIVEIRADRNVILDEGYIAPALNCAAQPPLAGFLAELQGLLHHRGEALAARVAAPGATGTAEVADFLLLQAINRYEPLLAHFAADAGQLHPETFYGKALEIAGELATFVTRSKRPSRFPSYDHTDLQASFAPLVADLRQALSAVLEQNAVPIPLQERPYGVRVGIVQDRALFSQAAFVLAVKADIPVETLRRNFPHQAKVGPVEQIAQLVNVALPGIELRPLPVAPRQLPFHASAVYFEMERNGPHWKQMQQPGGSGGIAVYVPGDLPGLGLELWAIKGSNER
jgi:type VI secretion system protein ImpJ